MCPRHVVEPVRGGMQVDMAGKCRKQRNNVDDIILALTFNDRIYRETERKPDAVHNW